MPFDGSGYDQVIATLLRAKAIIQQRGWARRDYGTDLSSRCLVSAIREAAGCRHDSPYALSFYLEQPPGASELAWEAGVAYGKAIDVANIQVWQDAPGCKIEDVMNGFDRAVEFRLSQLPAR